MKNKLFAKILAGLLAVLMVVGLLPLIASAETSSDTSSDTSLDNLHLNKTAVLQDDGTWTITLEAYATGEVKAEVTKQVTPTDIILVLDQSGSMEDEEITVSGGYQVAGDVTNATLLASNGSYYYYDKNDDAYYLVTTTKQLAVQDSYWYKVDENGNPLGDGWSCLESAADGVVATSWTIDGQSVNLDSGYGYLVSDYLIYKSTVELFGDNDKGYGYELVANGEDYKALTEAQKAPVSGESSRANAFTALNTFVGSNFPGKVVDSTNYWFASDYYAIVYTPVKLYDNSTYYYTYTYTDAAGQVWTIGHSAQFTSANDAVSTANFDAATLGNLYTLKADSEETRLYALKQASKNFVSHISNAAVDHAVDHRIAVVGFSGNNVSKSADGVNYQYINSELFIGSTQYNYWDTSNTNGNVNQNVPYDKAFQSVNTTGGLTNLNNSIEALTANGPTYADSGFLLAQSVAAANATYTKDDGTTGNVYTDGVRKLVVVFLTDGDPGWNGFGDKKDGQTTAEATDALATELETTYNATIYAVAMLDSAPTADSDSVLDDSDDFLRAVATDGTYTLADTGVDLTNFFHSVENVVQSTTANVELTSEAFLVDRVSEYFNMPADITQTNLKNYVKVYTAPHIGNHEFGANTEVTNFNVDASVDTKEQDGVISVWLTTGSTDGKPHGITLHNWDFTSTANLVTTSADGLTAAGNKLVVTISGITAKDSAAMDGYVNTNNEHSGIWDKVEDSTTYGMLKAFPMPVANIVNRTYVIDYAEPALLDTDSSIRNALALDSAKDGVFSKLTVTDDGYSSTTLTTTSSNAAVAFGDAKIENNKLHYTPKTTNWNGYDSFYVFWTSQTTAENTGIGDPVTGNGWSKVNVIPANNVYYEDSFVTTSTDGTTDTGVVGIEFSDSFKTIVGTEPGNTEQPENLENETSGGIHGWVDSLADDTGYSDGSAHSADFTVDANGNATAKASFTFTGTGMDIYSRTNNTTGTILVKVAPDDATKAKGINTKYFIVDTLAASGDYYQIPVISYQAVKKTTDVDGNTVEELVHGTYTVTITVTGGAATEEYGNRKTFILDGIRIYHPISNEGENDPILDGAYGEEVDAIFTEVRDLLLDAHSFGTTTGATGFVFIDQIKEGDVTSEETSGNDDAVTGQPTKTNAIGIYEDYGPKNEVYLSKGQGVAFYVGHPNTVVHVGLKSPTGAEVKTVVSAGESNTAEIVLNHTTDMYYEVTTDASGYAVVKNTSDVILSVTKVKTFDGITIQSQQVDEVALLSAVDSFDAMPVMAYSLRASSSETEEDTEVETPEVETPEVEITVPEVPSVEEQLREQIARLVAELFSSVRNWFIS